MRPRAVDHFKAAAAAEDGHAYIEPPDWYYPVRHSLGMALLKADRAGGTEAVYREDLLRFPQQRMGTLRPRPESQGPGQGHDRGVQAVPDGVGLRGYSADRFEVLERQ